MQRMTGGTPGVVADQLVARAAISRVFAVLPQASSISMAKDGVVLVADREGRQVFSSVTPDVASLPPRNNRALGEKVFAEQEAAYSNLFTGTVKKR